MKPLCCEIQPLRWGNIWPGNCRRVYGYQLLNGTRRMSRTHLIRTALFLRMDIKETERLLRLGGEARLYARDRTDARVIFAIEKKLPFRQAWLFIWPEELD